MVLTESVRAFRKLILDSQWKIRQILYPVLTVEGLSQGVLVLNLKMTAWYATEGLAREKI